MYIPTLLYITIIIHYEVFGNTIKTFIRAALLALTYLSSKSSLHHFTFLARYALSVTQTKPMATM